MFEIITAVDGNCVKVTKLTRELSIEVDLHVNVILWTIIFIRWTNLTPTLAHLTLSQLLPKNIFSWLSSKHDDSQYEISISYFKISHNWCISLTSSLSYQPVLT